MSTIAPRSQYPRPDRDRSQHWHTLNGTWDFTYHDGDRPVATRITVPFAWETADSGVARSWLSNGSYHREVTVPEDWQGRRTFLCFGAVHHHAEVLIDRVVVAEHEGGHTPFEIDITRYTKPGWTFDLDVNVHAPTDKRAIPHGKQRSIPRDDYDGVSFTPTSGIWQPVWLEARGSAWADNIHLDGTSLTGFDITLDVHGDAPAEARVTVEVINGSNTHELLELEPGGTQRRGRLELDNPCLWSPTDPHLYRLQVTTHCVNGDCDEVLATGGLRSIETAGEMLFLNGERLYVRGILDQGYWPTSGLTAPTEEALIYDLALTQRLGYNLVRKHIKLEEPRWLHEADQRGILVWAEPPGPSRHTLAGAAAFEAQLPPMVVRDRNHPSIIIWGLYNEEWGLDWNIPGSPERAHAAKHAYDTMKALDGTRLVVDNSGWAHVQTDLVDWHYYDEDPRAWAANLAGLATGERDDFPVKLGPNYVVHKSLYGSPDHPRQNVPILNSEYGAGFTSLERAWHLRWQTQEIRRHDRFAGYVYTELADVEHEMAGIVDADRRTKDLGGLDPTQINADTVLVLDLLPVAAGADIEPPTGPITLDVRISHHGQAPLQARVRAAWAAYGSTLRATTTPQVEASPVKVEPFRLSDPVTLALPAPGAGSMHRLHLWLVDDDRVVASTYVDAAPIEEPNRP